MYPVSVAGRIIACLCALVGAGMMGMLVSILVEKYQRVHKRKMYVPKLEVQSPELDRLMNLENGQRRCPSIWEKFKPNSRRISTQSHRIQFMVSVESEHLGDNDTNSIIATVKEKINEAVINTNPGINLQVTGNIQNA